MLKLHGNLLYQSHLMLEAQGISVTWLITWGRIDHASILCLVKRRLSFFFFGPYTTQNVASKIYLYFFYLTLSKSVAKKILR